MIYRPHAGAGFVLDGHYLVEQNPAIKQPALFQEIWTKDFFAAYKSSWHSKLNYYRPLAELSFVPDYMVWQTRAFGYRLTNVLLHFFNAVLVYILFNTMYRRRKLAFFASFFFAILPVHEWVVNYVVGRGDLLQCLFSLSSLIFVVRFGQTRARKELLFSVTFFVLALLSREVSVLLPLYAGLLIYPTVKSGRETVKIMVPFAGVALLYAAWRTMVFPIVESGFFKAFTIGTVQAWAVAAVEYAYRYLVPWTVLYHLPEWTRHPLTVLCVFAAAGACVIARMRQNDAKPLAIGAAWMLLSLTSLVFTMDVIDRLGPYLSEHFLYFGAVGFSLALIGFVVNMRSEGARQLMVITLGLYFITVNIFNNMFWVNEETILEKARGLDPNPYSVAAQQMVMRYEEDPQLVSELIARHDHPAQKSVWVKRMGNIYHRKGQYVPALRYLQEAVTLNPANLDARNELAVCYLETGKWEEGMRRLDESLALDPAYHETNRLKGVALYRRKDFTDAIPHLERAVYFAPQDTEAALHLSMAYFLTGQAKDYQRAVDHAISVAKNQVDVMAFIAAEMYYYGYPNLSLNILETAEEAVARDPRLRQLKAAAENQVRMLERETDQ